MEHSYSEEAPNSSAQSKHKEEGEKRKQICKKINHPLSINSDVLYNIVNGQVTPK